MESVLEAHSPPLLKLLAHDLRWSLVGLLALSDRRVGELVRLVDQPQNLVSYHLGLLRRSRVVQERRSSRDGRDVYYSLDLAHLRAGLVRSAEALHPALGGVPTSGLTDAQLQDLGRSHPRVLSLCTSNSARSQMAEAILRTVARGAVEVHSAGSQPRSVHPMTIRVLEEMGYDASGLRSKSIDEFSGQVFDYIVTLCDSVVEECPVFPGDPQRIHWSFPDPAAVQGDEEAVHQAFVRTATELLTRIRFLLVLAERRFRPKENR